MKKNRKNQMGKLFVICYYISSLLPQYFLLLILYILGTYEKNSYNLNLCNILSIKKIVFYFILIFILISTLSLFYIRYKLNEIQKNTIAFGEYNLKLSYKRNPGFREFFLNMLIPIISTVSIIDSPITSLSIVFMLQVIIFCFYYTSSDVFPNISLLLINYRFYSMDKSENSNYNFRYILGKNNKPYENAEVTVIPLIPRDQKSKFSIIKKGVN